VRSKNSSVPFGVGLSPCAERGGHCIHCEASRAQAFARIGRFGREAGKDQEPVGGEFARIFRPRRFHGIEQAMGCPRWVESDRKRWR